ncbi:hypothetical protein [Actinomadura sp. 6K520]|uniref:hypothetical protein n=1 Tax=Actinomadura sp. 6K520 TaxID=2530364 RepID=UPI001047A84B|nr:hypothetical protein [Actinomadura sp. 6K520]TDE39241.1 hypothetical protein E1289_01250 [Actinomadura sp. 6K520]
MRARSITVLLAAALVVQPPLSARPAAAAAPARAAEPGVSAEPGAAAAGTTARVRGGSWTPGATVQVQICGANAVHGSADCDTERGVTAMVAPAGTFEAGLTVGAPPAACPCVVRVTTLPGGTGPAATATAPFTVEGHPVERIVRDVVPVRADVVGLEVVGGGDRAELFGGRPRRTLVLRIRNSGAEPIENTPLVVGWGAEDTPDSPLDAPRTGTLQPGRTATYRIPVVLPPAAFGQFVVGGRYAGSVPFETTFSAYPWGLIGANALAALLLLFGIRLALGRWAAARRRKRRGASASPAHHPVAPRAAPGVELTDVLGYLDSVAPSPSGAYVVDRAELIGYLERRTGEVLEPVDAEALDRFLAPPRGEAV